MNIFLLSDTYGLHESLKERLAREISSRGNRIAYLSSSPQDASRVWFHNTESEYASICSDSALEYFDLSDSFSDTQLHSMLNFGMIHLSGGNTYEFLHTLKERNIKPILEKHLAEDGLIVGVSAGAIVLTPHIGTSALCGDVDHVGLRNQSGFSFADFCFLPHLGTNFHYTKENHTQLQAYASTHQRRIYIASDQDGVQVSHGSVTIFGNPLIIEP